MPKVQRIGRDAGKWPVHSGRGRDPSSVDDDGRDHQEAKQVIHPESLQLRRGRPERVGLLFC